MFRHRSEQFLELRRLDSLRRWMIDLEYVHGTLQLVISKRSRVIPCSHDHELLQSLVQGHLQRIVDESGSRNEIAIPSGHEQLEEPEGGPSREHELAEWIPVRSNEVLGQRVMADPLVFALLRFIGPMCRGD